MASVLIKTLIETLYMGSVVLLIWGLKQMSSPITARRGIWWSGVGMVVATAATAWLPDVQHMGWILAGMGAGGGLAYWISYRVPMANMPQMIALFNGMGGGAAACIAAAESLHTGAGDPTGPWGAAFLGICGAWIGAVSFTGSGVAFAKLQGWMDKAICFPYQQLFNGAVLLGACVAGGIWLMDPTQLMAWGIFVGLAAAWGICMTLPIGGADMPVVIALYNALTGLAVAFEGYAIGNIAMVIAGTVVGASGTLLTQLMAKAMNRPLLQIVGGSHSTHGASDPHAPITGTLQEARSEDAAALLAYATQVIIVPGYGMAVAQAQHKVWELAKLLRKQGITVRFAIHPVAGRMPGHMNVLLAEAGVPYDAIVDLEDINPDFANTDVTVVIGANDVVNPLARTDPSSPIYGMPILDADHARHVLVIKRGQGTGFSGIPNALFYLPHTQMVYGDAQTVLGQLIQQIKPYLDA